MIHIYIYTVERIVQARSKVYSWKPMSVYKYYPNTRGVCSAESERGYESVKLVAKVHLRDPLRFNSIVSTAKAPAFSRYVGNNGR